MSTPKPPRSMLYLGIGAMLFAVLLWLAFLWLVPAHAQSKHCQSVYNPHTGQWEYQCVERDPNDYRAPVCRQEYDPMNRQWVTVCE